MEPERYHLAQINVGRVLAPVGSPEIAEFIDALPEINALADAAPGFVWRLVGDGDDATGLRPFDDDLMLINASVWESLESLRDYVFRSEHTAYLRRRREWFERMEEAYVALWWVPAGHIPTVAEMVEKLELLRANGPGPEVFTFRVPFPPPGAQQASVAVPAPAVEPA
jgi:Domain of unknown function (DUF3291)